ncbi:hypothetical protein BTA51_21730 [Hahella sp. CCB-MM4]|uniref:sirohydrochlorin chelatase n=1 Tax=Hahella sp. (strain CCB-MM4) TaxID=1926491 RepID=UPI000B9C3081|nr:CbiX/SirB N-terminal domain-containing protein [Hahella sp. CCB-MM4]OZG71270.1 hypothetical protein BTA51_21730 [Hahella sp. CCB-MM4]
MRSQHSTHQYDHTILLAHGSRDEQWAAPFFELEKALIEKYPSVSVAFMELTSPTIEDSVKMAKTKGARQIAILPLFFATGKHLKTDVPAMLEPLRLQYDVTIDLLPPVGEQNRFRQMMMELVGSLLSEHS